MPTFFSYTPIGKYSVPSSNKQEGYKTDALHAPLQMLSLHNMQFMQ